MEKYTEIGEDFYDLQTRMDTYGKWPYKANCACTPERMARAGFIHKPCGEDVDAVICFFCFKELEGWERDDVPLTEHKKHSSGCGFLTLNKDFKELTAIEFVKLETERNQNLLKKIISIKKTEFQEQAAVVRKQLHQLHKL